MILFQVQWQIDSHLQEKKQLLIALEGAQSYVPNPRKRSLQRMEMYVKTLFQKEFQTEWALLQIQLVDVTTEEIQLYPAVCERAATVKMHPGLLSRIMELA